MSASDDKTTDVFVLNPSLRRCLGFFFVLTGIGILFGAMSIPFIHESFTIKYKFGLERISLRTGQVIGAAGATLMLFQFLLSGRLKMTDRIFAVNRLYRCHRINGMTIAVLVLLHGALVLYSEGTEILTATLENWPQYMGLVLLAMTCGLVFVSRWRSIVGLSYSTWRFIHTKVTHLAVAVLGIHVLYACDTFKYPPPRNWLFISLGIYVLLFVTIKAGWLIGSRRFEVVHVSPAGREAFAVKLRPADGKGFAFVPGQFVFIRFKAGNVPAETHPFTISSSPASTPDLELTIRSSGDWTGKVSRLMPGDGARINGPYGLFGNVRMEDAPQIIMIAGGIGITPMLSVLADLSDKGDLRPITLLWSNRTPSHMVHPDRIAALENRLKGLWVVHIFTRQPNGSGRQGRLDAPELGRLLSECNRRSKVLICGPPFMMMSVRRALLSLGFHRRDMVMERFDL